MPLPPFVESERTVRALRLAIAMLRAQGIPETKQREEWLNPYLQENGERLFGRTCHFTQNQTNTFVNSRSMPRPTSIFLEGLWRAYIAHGQEKMLERAWQQAGEQEQMSLAGHVHHMLTPDAKFNRERLRDLQGDFVAYRPFFRNPDFVMVMKMKCGIGGSEERFSIDVAWPDVEGNQIRECVEGVMVPYEGSCLFLGKICAMKVEIDRNGNEQIVEVSPSGFPFVFVLTNFARNQEGTGVVLVGAADTLSSAYPIHIRRKDTGILVPTVISRQELYEFTGASEDIIPIMDRGFTRWRP